LNVTAPVVYAGLSMGGYIGWDFFRKYGSRLAGLVLCDTRATPDTPQAAAARLQTARQVLAEGTAPLADSMIAKLLAPATFAAGGDVVELVRRMILESDPRAVAAAACGMAQRPDATLLLSRIACPALLLVGQFDALTPVEEMRALAQAIAGSRFEIIPDAGHMTPIENPAATTAAIARFLATVHV
jgi:3-oxoadipate enol-lactonase